MKRPRWFRRWVHSQPEEVFVSGFNPDWKRDSQFKTFEREGIMGALMHNDYFEVVRFRENPDPRVPPLTYQAVVRRLLWWERVLFVLRRGEVF